MPLGEIEKEVLRVMAANRNPDSYVAGGTVLHQDPGSPRTSEDVDVFHDAPESLTTAFEWDVAALRGAGFEVQPVGRQHDTLRRAVVRKAGHQTKVEWAQDSAFRFFPVESDPELGWRLNFWDGATNKVLALAGRQKLRDFLDCLHLHRKHLHLGALAWAAAGKDPGLTPEFILDWALRGNRFGPDDLAEVRWEAPLDWVATKQEWFGAVRDARALVERLPAQEMGCLYLDARGTPVCPDPASPAFPRLTRHFGCLKGAWPQIGEM
jgi:hypothetical protein